MRSDPVCAQASSADEQESGQLQEVVVSVQFREENLQRTPIAISAFTSENIEARGISSVTDAAGFVPNAVIQPLGAGWGSTIAAYIRGVGLGDNILSFEPGVPIYIDDVYFGRPQGAIFDLLDLERIEVLRGPQGTLFGKNAIGGTVRLISKKPTGEGGGYVSAHQSKITFLARTDPNDTVNGFQEGYTLLNGHITWHSAERDWEVGLYGLNLTDKEYFLGRLSLVGLFGREQGNVAAPREIGITIKRTF